LLSFLLLPKICPRFLLFLAGLFFYRYVYIWMVFSVSFQVAYLTRIDVFSAWSFFITFIMMMHHAVGYLYRPDEDGDDDKKKDDDKKEMKEMVQGEEKAVEKKEEKKDKEAGEPKLNCLGLPYWSDLTGQRKADLLGAIIYFFSYSLSLIIIFERPVGTGEGII
jgi:hypothetical protein